MCPADPRWTEASDKISPRLRSQEKSLVSKTGLNGLVARGPGLVEQWTPLKKATLHLRVVNPWRHILSL